MRAGRWDHRVALLQQRLSQWWSALVQKRIRELRDAKERSLKVRRYEHDGLRGFWRSESHQTLPTRHIHPIPCNCPVLPLRHRAFHTRPLQNRTYRLIQAVLSREHPSETFLKSIPRSGKVLFHVEYPSSVPERLVRRRLRALARLQSYHARMRAIYGMTTLLLRWEPPVRLPTLFSGIRFMHHHKSGVMVASVGRA